jgi:hypothetical protein
MFKVSNKGIVALAAIAGAILLAGPAAAGTPTTLTRTMVVEATPSEVWALIGPFCAIKDWHPALASCELDGKAPPTRTLLTREGGARFVELQVARSDANHRYTYSFTSSPVPVSGYVATFSVKASGKNASLVTWQGSYTPNDGQDEAAMAALSGIYESGLAAIRDRFAHK